MHALSSVWAQLPDKDVAISAACTSRQTQKELKALIWTCQHSILGGRTCCHKVACPVNCCKWTRKVCNTLNDGGKPAHVRVGRTWEEGFNLAAKLPCVIFIVLEAD